MQLKRILRAGWLAVAATLVASPAYAHDAVAGEELSGAIEILIVSMVLLCGGLIVCFWAWRKGQFTDIEEPKYTMLKSESESDYTYIETPDPDEPALPATPYRSVEASQAQG